MRIISQDGLNDYPYDSIMVWVDRLNPKGIFATMCSDPDSEFPLGTYNSEEDALRVMKSIRKAAMDGYYYFYMPKAESASWWRQKEEEGGEV